MYPIEGVSEGIVVETATEVILSVVKALAALIVSFPLRLHGIVF